MSDADEILSCAASLYAEGRGALATPLPALGDAEGARVPDGLPPIVDAHVHLFPDRVSAALWRWFETHGWPIRYPLPAPDVVDFLCSRGVSRVVGLIYAHKPGLARSMNAFAAGFLSDPRVLPLGTVHPRDPDAGAIVEEAFALGLGGIKMHCHVQCFAPDDPAMNAVYEACARHRRPLVMHAGREPKSPAYACDPHALCAADRVERALADHPRLKLCVPHLGADEFDAYGRLLERYENLWVDTTMVLADYLPVADPRGLLDVRPERILYGTDFPNLPYAWDRELRKILELRLPEERLEGLLGGNARRLFGIAPG